MKSKVVKKENKDSKQPKEKIFLGVCYQLSKKLNIDVKAIRIIFILMFFMNFIGVIIYGVLFFADHKIEIKPRAKK